MTVTSKKPLNTKLAPKTEERANETKKRPTRQASSDTATTIVGNNQDSHLNGIGPYEFIKPLGNGKFSRVMLAFHLETQQQVAIKIIDKQAHDYRVMSRLVREISIMEILEHQCIVKLYETYESCDSLFLVMEYVPGCNLDEYLHKKNTGALDEHEARHLFRQLVSAVNYCHRKWVVHRDLKTPNILITEGGSVKLADFGLGNRYGLQKLRTICGSMLYYSPEIISSQKYYGPEVDCWCLGITLFRMTAGFEPFSHAHTVGELKKDVCKCNFPMPDTLSPELQATIRKCLQADRRKRMTLRQALKDDPWLTAFGTLPCPVSSLPKTVFEETMVADMERENSSKDDKTRKQFMKDMERDSNIINKVKKTVFYHPINPSTYYTTKASNSMTPGQIQNVELLRSELLQSIRSRARRLGIKSAGRWELRSPGLKLLFASFTPHRKTKDTPSSINTSNRSISEIVQRIAKDRVYHFQLLHNDTNHLHSSRPPSLSSSTSSSSISSILVDDNEAANFEQDIGKKNWKEVMALLRQTCQLMGISYVQDSPTSLQCVLTLRDAPKKNVAPSPTKPPTNRRQSQTSSAGTSVGNDSSHTRHSKRLSLPLLSHLTSSMTTSFFARNKPRHSMDETTTITKEQIKKKKTKDGMAMFTIEIESHKRRHDKINLRFSKQQGSGTVFKMAGGWVAGVMALDGKIGR